MKAKVTTEFPGRPDGEALARTIAVDEVISGDLAEVAVSLGLAEAIVAEPDVDVVEPQPEIELEDLTVEQLKALADEKGVDLETATKKAEIVAVLQAAAQPAA